MLIWLSQQTNRVMKGHLTIAQSFNLKTVVRVIKLRIIHMIIYLSFIKR